jgi:hypothetical protein
MKQVLRGLLAVTVLVVVVLLAVKVRFGGGHESPNVSTPPRAAAATLEALIALDCRACVAAASAVA